MKTQNAQITVALNGVKLYDNQALDLPHGARRPSRARRPRAQSCCRTTLHPWSTVTSGSRKRIINDV